MLGVVVWEFIVEDGNSPREGKENVKPLGCIRLFVTPWAVAHQAPPSVEFSRPRMLEAIPFSGELPDPGIESGVSCNAGRFFNHLSRVTSCETLASDRCLFSHL